MLTLKAPIEIKSRRDFVHDNESFYDRINANYMFIGREIGSEELMHIANTPPEVYIAEGDITTVSGNTVMNSHNEEKLDIINNVLNRIVVSADAHLTYQDRAYITDVLYKMGIRDDRKFMSEVRRIMNENRDEERLINLYLMDSLISNNEEVNTEIANLASRVSSIEENDFSRNFATSIMNRLNTGAVYQIVSNFNRSFNENRINIGEFAVTEQGDAAKKILTDRIAEEYFHDAQTLIYREGGAGDTPDENAPAELTGGGRNTYIYNGDSIYEREILSESTQEINVTEELGSALFLDIVKNLISNTYEKNERGYEQWFDFKNVLYHSSDNLFRRINYLSEESLSAERFNEYNYEIEGADISYPESEEETGQAETEPDVYESFERELRQLNERNLNNVERYNEIMKVLNTVRQDNQSGSGAERTRREALRAIEENADIVQLFNEEDASEDDRREQVFREAMRLFPDNSMEVFNILEQYMDNPAGQAENISIARNNIAEAADEIRRQSSRDTQEAAPEVYEQNERREELIFRENASLDIEEIKENIEEIKRNSSVSREVRQNDNAITENVTTQRNVVNTVTSSFTNEQTEDIAELVNRGVRSQMGMISEQVLNKLEKRLRNEKSRRGI